MDSVWNREFIFCLIDMMLLALCQQLSNAMLSVYADSMGASASQIGILMGMFAITALIFRLSSGPLMNSFSRKLILVLSNTLYAISYLGIAFSSRFASITGIPFIKILYLFRLMQGVSNAFGNTCLLVIVTDSIPHERMASGVGIYACMQIVAQAIGPTIGVIIRNSLGYDAAYLFCAGSMTFCAFISLAFVRVRPVEKTKFRLNLSNIFAFEAFVPLIVLFLVFIGYINIKSYLILYAERNNVGGGRLFFILYAITCLLTRTFASRLDRKFGFVRTCVPAIIIASFSLYLIGIARSAAVLLVTAFLHSFGYGLFQPAVQSLCMKSVGEKRRGTASSSNYIALDTATLVGHVVFGKAASLFGYTPVVWTILAGISLFGAAVVLVFSGKIRRLEKAF